MYNKHVLIKESEKLQSYIYLNKILYYIILYIHNYFINVLNIFIFFLFYLFEKLTTRQKPLKRILK